MLPTEWSDGRSQPQSAIRSENSNERGLGDLGSEYKLELWGPLDDQMEDQITQWSLSQKSKTPLTEILMKAWETRILNGLDENCLHKEGKCRLERMAYLKWSENLKKMFRIPRINGRPDWRDSSDAGWLTGWPPLITVECSASHSQIQNSYQLIRAPLVLEWTDRWALIWC